MAKDVKVLRWGDYLGLCRWVPNEITSVSIRGREIFRQEQCDSGGRDWNDATPSQGLLAATKSCKKQGAESSLEPLGLCQHLDFGQ